MIFKHKRSREYIRGYIAAVLEGKSKKGIEVNYGFGTRGLGLYLLRNTKLIVFIPDNE